MTTYSGTKLADILFGSGLSDLMFGLEGNDSIGGSLGADTLDGGAGADTLTGGAGNDSYVIDSAVDKIVESVGDLNDRVLAAISVDLNLPAFANIEHATLTGTGALVATGNGGANMLVGNAGANKLDGKGGDDTAAGGAGNDVYEVDSGKDLAIENAGEGIDQVNSSADFYQLGTFVENLTLIGIGGVHVGIGNALANKIIDNAGSNFLDGQAGNDTLIGNDGDDRLTGESGADSLVGGNGADTYFVDDIGDKVLESGPAGELDEVRATIAFTLGAALESLALLGAANIDGTGNALNNFILGNKGNNVLSGLAGNDVLRDVNGGDDLLLGGDGNDDLGVEERFNPGVDTLVGGAGSDKFGIFGDPGGVAHVIADFNGLPGGDQLGLADVIGTLVAGSESLFIQTVTSGGSTTIRVDQDGLGGKFAFVDLVVLQGVSTDLTGLLANGAILNVGTPATSPIDGTAGNDVKAGAGLSDLIRGFAGNDSLTGNNGFDTLDGGTGMDTLAGGGGSDSYVIDNAKDVIAEAAGDANDRVLASIAVDLSNKAFDNIEHVTLTGTAALNATGDEGANMLIGNSGANVLDGGGDNDTLVGGAGNDTYKVDSVTDLAIENPGEGTDTVISSASFFTLGAFVENLTLASNLDIDGIGNALANNIIGNSGINDLSGGDGNDTLIGNDGQDALIGDAGADSLVGGTGGDLYVVDNVGDKIMESGPASDIDRVVSTISFVLGANLENLSLFGDGGIDGTGNALNNSINGNAEANVLNGMAGDDSLTGGAGDDLLLGGAGNDTLFGEFSGADADTLVGGAGSDRFAFLAASLTGADVIADLDGLPGGDHLDLSGVSGKLPVVPEPQFIEAVTAGGSTTVRIDQDGLGGKFAFVDLVVLQGVSTDLNGLLANGTIVIDGLPIVPPAASKDGTAVNDILAAAATSTLVRGLGGNDLLTGNGGADTLDGGKGLDTMVGGAGDDSYVVDNIKDAISELGGDLNDRVLAAIAVDLNSAALAGIEHATLTGTAALNATGNGGANMLIGNAGANLLDGSTGNDTLIGGAGNDTYKVDSDQDLAIENPGEGTDTVISSAPTFTLGAFVENLTLADNLGIGGFGNALANKITGNSGNNELDGGDGNDTLIGNDGIDFISGGAGADSLVGGNGGDIYLVDNVGDKIIESGPANEGDEGDSVFSTITFTLGANLENLRLLGDGGTDGTGNALNNFIGGSDGDNVLRGLAGNDSMVGDGGNDLLLGGDGNDLLAARQGVDTLVGGAGSDRFEFDAVGLSGLDVIADFNGLPGGDTIDVSGLLSGFVEDVSNVNDFLRAVQANGGTTLQVDTDGAVGGVAFVDMVVLQGVNTSIGGLLNDGSLLLD